MGFKDIEWEAVILGRVEIGLRCIVVCIALQRCRVLRLGIYGRVEIGIRRVCSNMLIECSFVLFHPKADKVVRFHTNGQT